MGWDEQGRGFFGSGYWGRRVLWDNVPVQHRALDVNGYLEDLLRAYGDTLEGLLGQIAQLPLQRDPYEARGLATQAEWFYVTQALRQEDATWGPVVRLVGERDGAAMPASGRLLLAFDLAGYVACAPSDVGMPVRGVRTGHAGTLLAYDNVARIWWVDRAAAQDVFDAAEVVRVTGGAGSGVTLAAAQGLSPWFPYEPIDAVARWWRATIPTVEDATGVESPAEYEVALVRTRNYDPAAIYDADRSLANEVWVQGGDLVLPFQYPNGWLITGNAEDDAGSWGGGVPIGRGTGTASIVLTLPGPAQRLAPNVSAGPAYTTAGARLVIDANITGMGDQRAYDAPDATLGPDMGRLYPEDGTSGNLDLATPLGIVDYLSGTITGDLSAYAGPTFTDGATITAHWVTAGYYLQFSAPRTLGHLALDYGFEADRNDPEEQQRAAIAHLHQYFGCKGAQDAYRIRGEISLFELRVVPLWRLCEADQAGELPADRVFEYDGRWYTDVDPRPLHFDDIRADEQYYDTFDHDPASPGWLTLADRAQMFEDDAYVDGMSAALAFALDVTQGFYAPVSETNITPRTPALVMSCDALAPAEAVARGLVGGWRVGVRMERCQADAFHWSKGRFGLTVYEGGVTPPALDDEVFWIDAEETAWTYVSAGTTPEEDLGDWTVIVGVGLDANGDPLPGPTVGADVAVRYWPAVDVGNCCYCRSYYVRVEVEPLPQAYTYYETTAALRDAVERIKDKVLSQLLPIHARVIEWAFTSEFQVQLDNVKAGATVRNTLDQGQFADLTVRDRVLVTLEQRGDLESGGETQTIALRRADDAALTPALVATGVQSGYDDPLTWYPVAGWEAVDITDSILSATAPDYAVLAKATATATVANGDVRCTFRVTRNMLG